MGDRERVFGVACALVKVKPVLHAGIVALCNIPRSLNAHEVTFLNPLNEAGLTPQINLPCACVSRVPNTFICRK